MKFTFGQNDCRKGDFAGLDSKSYLITKRKSYLTTILFDASANAIIQCQIQLTLSSQLFEIIVNVFGHYIQ